MSSSADSARPSWILTLGTLALVVAVLYLAKGVLVPLTLAAMLAFLLTPVCDWLERRKLGRIPSVLITVILAFALLGAGAWTTALQIMDLAPKLPEYQSHIQTKLHSVNGYLSTALGRFESMSQALPPPREPATDSKSLEERPALVRIISSPSSPLQIIGSLFGSLLVVMGSTGIVLILVVYMLLRREDLRNRLIRLVGKGQLTVTTQTLEDAAGRVSRFLLMQLFVNLTFGVPIAIGLHFIGVPNALLWGILATFLRFIPYLGAWSSAAAPIGLSLAISTDWVAPILTVGLFVTLELLISNIMEPWIYGKNTGVSSVAILISAVFWTWIWGPIGLLLAMPLTVCLLVIGKHVPELSYLDTLLGSDPVLDPKTRVYQRLLAGDPEEAVEVLLDDLEHRPLVEVYDTVLIPALALAEFHWRRGDLDATRHTFMLQSLRAAIEELGESRHAQSPQEPAPTTTQPDGDVHLADASESSKPRVLCLPAHDEADELAGMMLKQLLEMSGCLVQVVSVTALVSEMVDLVEQHQADVVCISATPPAATMHARYLGKRIRARCPQVNMVVGLWNTKGDLNKATQRVDCGDATHLVGMLGDAQSRIRQLVQPLVLRRAVQDQPEVAPTVMAEACP